MSDKPTWFMGPTEQDPDPGSMWCTCGARVYAMDDVYHCGNGHEWADAEPSGGHTFPVWVREAAARMELKPPVLGPRPDRDAYRRHIEQLAEDYGLPVDGPWPRWAGSEPIEY